MRRRCLHGRRRLRRAALEVRRQRRRGPLRAVPLRLGLRGALRLQRRDPRLRRVRARPRRAVPGRSLRRAVSRRGQVRLRERRRLRRPRLRPRVRRDHRPLPARLPGRQRQWLPRGSDLLVRDGRDGTLPIRSEGGRRHRRPGRGRRRRLAERRRRHARRRRCPGWRSRRCSVGGRRGRARERCLLARHGRAQRRHLRRRHERRRRDRSWPAARQPRLRGLPRRRWLPLLGWRGRATRLLAPRAGLPGRPPFAPAQSAPESKIDARRRRTIRSPGRSSSRRWPRGGT